MKAVPVYKSHHVIDSASTIIVGASLLNYAPEGAAAAAFVWYVIQIIQSRLVIKSWQWLLKTYKYWW